jgi:hypothetical protein
MPSHHFKYNSVNIWQSFSVSKTRQPVLSNDSVNLCLSFLRYFRIEDHGQEECMNRCYSLKIFVNRIGFGKKKKRRKGHAVSAPPEYSEAADHLISCSSLAVIVGESSRRREVKEDCAVPAAYEMATK